ncbi:recombinase family protein [Tranquillimonas alkanivorans]|uniref:Site-specific DNA recombinase n=1 Tax=Tranquillimonas alkanivorans TaxID=441119 RepID=A0A1I5PBZ4_9RHOB|nr:recombinase family protein [Tranquillimonas alkanivorans]SFP31622.1 Site-specific DNA recombinase [Tranquillimonas alkanivorans]
MRIGYRRVSTEDQNLERQELADCEKVFEEKVSGAKRDRPALVQMMEWAREGDEVVVHSLDRLGRDLRDLQGIVQELNDKGVCVEFLQERLRFSPGADDPLSRLQLQMMGAFAEFERNIIRKRQAEGIARAKAKGVYKGRRATIDAAEVQRLRAEGLGASAIASQLGIGRASVYRVLNGSYQASEAR